MTLDWFQLLRLTLITASLALVFLWAVGRAIEFWRRLAFLEKKTALLQQQANIQSELLRELSALVCGRGLR